MKKIHALFAAAAFLAVLAALAPTYAYRQLAVIPTNLDAEVTAVSADGAPATYFSIPRLREMTSELSSVNAVRVDRAASKRASAELHRDALVMEAYACTDVAGQDCRAMRYPLSATLTTVAVDPRSGKALDWSGNSLTTQGTTDRDVAFAGYTVKLPFDAQRTTYPFWNGDLRKALPAVYAGTETLDGLRTYKYVQKVPTTDLGPLDLPGNLVGSREQTVAARLNQTGTTTLWAEPATGVIVSVSSTVDSYASVDGAKVLTVVDGTLSTPSSAVRATAGDYRWLARGLWALRLGVPVGAGVLSALTVVLALALLRRERRRTAAV